MNSICSLNESSGEDYWSGSAPVCDIITCHSLLHIQHSVVDVSDLTYSSTNYTCNERFDLVAGTEEQGYLPTLAWSGPEPEYYGNDGNEDLWLMTEVPAYISVYLASE